METKTAIQSVLAGSAPTIEKPETEPVIPANESVPATVIESPEIGRIVGLEIQAVNAARQAELERAARLAAQD